LVEIDKKPNVDYILINYNYWVVPPTAEGKAIATHMRERIIRNGVGTWEGMVHEHILVDWLKSEPIDGAFVWHLRDTEDMTNDSERNLRIMKKLIKESPSARNYFYYGNELSAHGKTVEAISAYRNAYKKAKADQQTRFQASYKIGRKYHELGKLERAAYFYKKSLEHSSEYREPLIGLAEIYEAKNDYAKVVFWAKASLLIEEPRNPAMIILKDNYTWVPYNFLGKAYFNSGQYDESAEASENLYKYTKNPVILQDIALSRATKRKSYKRPEGNIRLNLGSGSKTIDGFINCDLFPQPGVDEVFGMDEIPYADRSVDEISTEHALEHLPRPDGERAVREFARVLKRGGKLTLKVPDLEECCRMFLARPDLQEKWYLHTLYGIQDFRNDKEAPFADKVNYGQIHYTGFTEKSLKKILEQNGFTVDKIWKYDGYDTPSLGVEAHIPNISAEKLKRVAFVNNSLVPKYLSYGDYWLEAFKASGHDVTSFRYEEVGNLPSGFDFYFFIEAGGRYDVNVIPPEASPRILYTKESSGSPSAPASNEIKAFDAILTPDINKANEWRAEGHETAVMPDENHLKQVDVILTTKWNKVAGVPVGTKATPITRDKRNTTQITDIIIPSYKNKEYIELTLDSVRKNTENYNVLVINSGDDSKVRDYLRDQKDIMLFDYRDKLTFSKAINVGLANSKNDVVLLNNDTIVGPGWLEALKRSPYDVTNPFSNCDAGWVHNQTPLVGGVTLRPDMQIPDVDVIELLNTKCEYQGDLLLEREWVAFYATYIKRHVIDATGLLDEDFMNGGEDCDYCRRAVKLGFTCGHNFDSWVFHFGAKTRKVKEKENHEKYHNEDRFNNEFLQAKSRPTVAIYCGPAWEQWTIENINTTGIGGSETCAAMLARTFVEKGYRAVIIGDCKDVAGIYDGVEYINHTEYDRFKKSNFIDYFISSRKMSPLAHPIKNGKNYVWSHDIFIPECVGKRPPQSEKSFVYPPGMLIFSANIMELAKAR
jgi:GT2 family glycosyltransferase/tetratricopeptide (TPR) repeat protein